MPLSYFFHLKLELYPTCATNASNKRQKIDHHTSSNCFIPPPGSDIFKSPLPAHRKSQWLSYSFPTHPNAVDRGAATNPVVRAWPCSTSSSEPSQSPNASPSGEFTESHGDALLLPERNLNLKKDIQLSPRVARVTKPSNESAARDWRYDSVEIESINMEKMTNTKAKSSPNGGLHTKAVYLPSDPKTTDVGWGVVHLYRDTEESSVLDGTTLARKSFDATGGVGKDDQNDFSPEDCTTLCILAVPSWMMPSDLLGFVGDHAREDVSHFRLIRTGRANKYMVLMKFRSAKKARDWQKVYNGRLFSAAEPENCHVVFVKSVDFLSWDSDLAGSAASFPQNTNDPFTRIPATNADLSRSSKNLSSKPLAPPPPNLLELPTCPVCLERMDETTGLLTILCQHVFHCACLEKWRGSGCPVCRYTHSPSYTFPYPRPSYEISEGEQVDTDPLCSVCATPANLWICLICGNIGCGRYDSAHAYAHYEDTSHCYAMDISTQHVWDYAGDGYVHRLIQSKPATDTSGGSADLPPRPRHENEAFRAEGGDSVPREKMESMAAEYTYLLTSQLEGQRRYFEEQVERAADKAAEASARAEQAASQVCIAHTELLESRTARDEMYERLTRIEKSLEKSEKTRAKFEQMARDMSMQLREEKTMNEGLMKRIRAADEKAEEAQKQRDKAVDEKRELEDMNRDLTMFISGQEKVKELQAQGEEVEDGTVSVPDPPAAKKGKGKGKKK